MVTLSDINVSFDANVHIAIPLNGPTLRHSCTGVWHTLHYLHTYTYLTFAKFPGIPIGRGKWRGYQISFERLTVQRSRVERNYMTGTENVTPVLRSVVIGIRRLFLVSCKRLKLDCSNKIASKNVKMQVLHMKPKADIVQKLLIVYCGKIIIRFASESKDSCISFILR